MGHRRRRRKRQPCGAKEYITATARQCLPSSIFVGLIASGRRGSMPASGRKQSAYRRPKIKRAQFACLDGQMDPWPEKKKTHFAVRKVDQEVLKPACYCTMLDAEEAVLMFASWRPWRKHHTTHIHTRGELETRNNPLILFTTCVSNKGEKLLGKADEPTWDQLVGLNGTTCFAPLVRPPLRPWSPLKFPPPPPGHRAQPGPGRPCLCRPPCPPPHPQPVAASPPRTPRFPMHPKLCHPLRRPVPAHSRHGAFH
eukprot:1156305-Pelagomonas_calceolata.AAC.8